MATSKERVKELVKEGQERSEAKAKDLEEAKKKPVAKKQGAQRSEEGPVASKYAKQVEGFAAMANSLAKSTKEKVFTLIQLENKAHSLNLKTQEAEKNLARLEADAQRAIAMGTAGVRHIAAELAKEKDASDKLQERLNLREQTIAKQELEIQELRSLYENRLAELAKVAKAVPGD